MSPAPSSALRLAPLVLIGVVLPTLFGALDIGLLASWQLVSLMVVLVVQTGLVGPLCALYIRPRWLLWLIYAWFWLMMDLMLVVLATSDPLPLESISHDTLPAGILSAQVSLVLIWAALGAARWTVRWPAALLLVVAILVPVFWHHMPPMELLILISLQCTIVLAITGCLACLGFRLACNDSAVTLVALTSREHTLAQPPENQFQLRDLLIWTTVLAIALAVARVINYWGSSFAAWEYIRSLAGTGRTLDFLLGSPTAAVLTALVLLVALWASLGQGSTFLRWSLFFVIVGAVSVMHGLHDYYHKPWTLRWALPLLLWSDAFWYYEQVLITWHWLTGGMLFAALLTARSLGYRLCRVRHDSPAAPSP